MEEFECFKEPFSVGNRDVVASLPGRVRGGAASSARACGGVCQESGGFDIIAGPFSGSTVESGDVVGTGFDGTDAGLHGAIILRSTWWRQHWADVPVLEEAAHFVGSEGAVVGFKDDRRSELSKEREQGIAGGLGGLVGGGQGEELIAAGEIAHDEDGGVETVDGRGRFGVIDGPDGAGPVPMELVELETFFLAPDAAVSFEESS